MKQKEIELESFFTIKIYGKNNFLYVLKRRQKMNIKLKNKLTLTVLLIISSSNVKGAELITGMKRMAPRTSILFRSFSSKPVHLGDELLNGLYKSLPIAQKVLSNCVTTLPPTHEYLRERFIRIGSSVIQIQNSVGSRPVERRSHFMKTFPGSSIYQAIQTELDEIGVEANQDPSIAESDAYKNVKEIAVNLGIEPEN